jgi:hypothetical protein
MPIPGEVQPRARADLAQPQRQPGLASDAQEAAQQRRAAPHLVGLNGARLRGRAQRVAPLGRDRQQRAPGAFLLEAPARRRVVRGERRRVAREHRSWTAPKRSGSASSTGCPR